MHLHSSLFSQVWKWWGRGGLLDYEIHQPCLLAHLLSHLLEIQAGPSHQATQSSVSLYRNEPDWDPFQFHQVSTGAERGQDQRRDHVELLRPGYEVCNGRSVLLRIRRLPLVLRARVCEWELRMNDIRWLSVSGNYSTRNHPSPTSLSITGRKLVTKSVPTCCCRHPPCVISTVISVERYQVIPLCVWVLFIGWCLSAVYWLCLAVVSSTACIYITLTWFRSIDHYGGTGTSFNRDKQLISGIIKNRCSGLCVRVCSHIMVQLNMSQKEYLQGIDILLLNDLWDI